MDKVDIQKLVGRNQTIKIVPSVEETMRGIGLNVDLDDNTKLWFEQLKVTWKTWKRSKAVENHVEQYFQTSPEPYRVTLVFVIKSEELKDCKPKSLPFFLMEALNKWASHNGLLPEESLKVPAFRIATQQRNQHFLNLVTKTYKLSTIKETIVATVRDMIKNDNCKQASQVVIAVELFDDIAVEDLMFPLILQDKTNMIDEYLSECPSQVVPLLQFLDKLLDKSFNIREYVQTYIEEYKICNVKYDKLHYRPMGKLVARLCNKFNIHIETCKNLSKNRTTGGLRYLIHQKYQGNNVSSSVWDDLVKDSLKQNIESAKEFIDMLTDYDIKEALKWASYLRLPEQELPLALKAISIQDTLNEEENWEATSNNESKGNYYQSPLSEEQIVIIDTGENFYNMMVSDLAQCHVVSIDCEWKPSFGATHSQVALIQIATPENVYLIDSMVLNKQEYSSFWYTFYKSLLDNAEIIKVGFGLEQDFKEMKASVIGLSNIKIKGEGLLDMSILWKNLINSGLTIPGNSDNGGSSLNALVQSCFGLPLEKSEQCSNWELRPLRTTQIKYAALDAYVLIEIYNYLQRLCDEQRINFEEICNDTMSEGKKKSIKKIKTIDRVQTSIFDNQSFCAQTLKLLVDPLLSNLMIYLRYCGIDTTVVSSSMLWHDVINLAISEERFIILEKLKCTPTVNYNQNSILHIGKGSNIELLQRIFTRFHLKVKQSDLMTRCINCNAKDFKHLLPDEVMLLCKEYIASSNYLPSRRYGADDDDDTNYDNFLSDSDCDEDLYQSVPNTYQNNKSCTTSKGTQIVICDVQKLLVSRKSATLCESCGKLYWEEDEMLLSTSSVIQDLTKLTLG